MADQGKKVAIGIAVLGATVLGFALLGKKAGAKPPPPPPPGGVEIPLNLHVFITGINGKKIIEESPGVYTLEVPIAMPSLQGVYVNFRYEGDPYLEADPGAWAGFAGYLAYQKAVTGEDGPGFQGTVAKGGPGYVSAIPVNSAWISGPYTAGLYDGIFNVRLYPYGIVVGDFTINGMAQVSTGGQV